MYILFAHESRGLETKVIFAPSESFPPFGVRVGVALRRDVRPCRPRRKCP